MALLDPDRRFLLLDILTPVRLHGCLVWHDPLRLRLLLLDTQYFGNWDLLELALPYWLRVFHGTGLEVLVLFRLEVTTDGADTEALRFPSLRVDPEALLVLAFTFRGLPQLLLDLIDAQVVDLLDECLFLALKVLKGLVFLILELN